jgi:hypothetical protein
VSWLLDLFGVYARVVRRAVVLTGRYWWLGLVAVLYEIVLEEVLPVVAMPFGIAGRFMLAIGFAALASSGLVLLGHVVREGRVRPADVPGSFGVHLLDVLTYGFLLWALRYVAGIAFADFPYAAIVFQLAVLVFLSAVPEQIYLAGEGGVAIFVGSYQFVATHWIEWLPAAAVLFVLWTWASTVAPDPLATVLDGFVLAFMGVCRGLLFLELTTSSRRAREFRRRAMG